jgi:ribonuclease P protein component
LSGKNTFSKAERLKSAVLTGRLFKEGNAFMAYPLRVVWLPLVQEAATRISVPVQVVFVAPKRTFKTAVQRNRVKRLMREAYRLQKALLYDQLRPTNTTLVLMLMCIAKEEPTFEEMQKGMKKMMSKLGHVQE